MPQRKIQLFRSATIYDSYDDALSSLNMGFAAAANLSDGEAILVRYKSLEPVTGGSPRETIRSIVAVYNIKNDLSDFTIISNQDTIKDVLNTISVLREEVISINGTIDETDSNFNVYGLSDVNIAQVTDDTSKVITSLKQENTQVYVGGTDVKDLTLKGYQKSNSTGAITSNDSLEIALNKLENTIATIDVDLHSNDESITINDDTDNGGKNFEVNIDETTILKNDNGALMSGLNMVKITESLPSNIRESYQLQDNEGTLIGSSISIYKDSSLKEVYLGTKWDSVDSVYGTIKHVHYIVQDSMIFIDNEMYMAISETDKSLYDTSSRTVYTINKATLTSEEFYNLDSEQSALYVYNASTNTYNIEVGFEQIYEDKYSALTESQKSLYTEAIENGYQIKEDKMYLSTEEYDEIFNGQLTDVYVSLDTISQQTGKSDFWQSLNFVYILDDGSYQMVKVDVSKFLTESEFGVGLVLDENGIVTVALGDGLQYRQSVGAPDKRIYVKIDPTSNGALTVSQNGLKLDLTDITDNQLTSVTEGNGGISVSQKANNTQSISLQLSETTLSNTADAQYAGETTEEEVNGETVETVVNNNVLQIKEDGLYLDSTWDCGEY